MLDTGKTIYIKLTDITVPPNRMRRLRPEKVDEIAESFRQRGQIQPVVVRQNGAGGLELIAGLHRLRGAAKVGWDYIRTEVREGIDADAAELIEIDENLIRADLSDAERTMHTARRKELYEKVHPETTQGGAPGAGRGKRKKSSEGSQVENFVSQTAQASGKGRSKVARDVTRGTKVKVLADIVGTALDQGAELDALVGLSEEEQRKLAERAKAGEKVSARTRVKQVAREALERKLGAKQCAWPIKKYGVILADPEWEDSVWSRETGMNRHAANHYAVSDLETIKSRDVASIAAEDCVLFLWTTNQHLRDAIDVMEAWGFKYVSNYVWKKTSAGLGFWNRSVHEILLIGTRGKIPCPAPGTQWDSIIEAPRPGEHSAKPECFLEMIEQYFPNLPKIELNRRGPPRPGWDAWGLEAEAAE
jgi:N6-adenosine-specific RNA methylase IME4